MPELLLQHVTATMQPRAHGANRNAKDVGDLLIGKIVDEVECAHGTKLVRQRRQRAGDVVLGHARHNASRRIGVGTQQSRLRAPRIEKDLMRVAKIVE